MKHSEFTGEVLMRFLTAGESHGPCLVGIVEGFPAGFRVDIEAINRFGTAPAGLRTGRAHAD